MRERIVDPLLEAMTADLIGGSVGGSHILGRCILNVAFPFAAVSDDAPGFAEQLVARLDHAIVERGGTSLVIAHEDSRVTGNLIPISPAPHPADVCREVRENIERTLYGEPIDLIHFHGVDFHRYFPKTAIPKLVTLHMPPGRYPKQIFSAHNKNVFLHCVSPSQHRECPDCDALLSPISDGIDEYLRRYEIIIRGCHASAGVLSYQA